MHSKPRTKKKPWHLLGITAGIAILVLLAVLILQILAVNERYGWRVDFAMTYLRALVDPGETAATVDITQVAAVESTPDPLAEWSRDEDQYAVPTASATATERPEASPTVTLTPAPTLPHTAPDR